MHLVPKPAAQEHAVAHAQFTVQRVLAAPPARVFAAWTDAAARQRWFVRAGDWLQAEQTHDFRIGGCEHGRYCRGAGEPVYDVETRYLDIVAERRVVSSSTLARDGLRIFAALLTVELQAERGGTRLCLTEQGAFLDRQDSSPAREQGWQALLDALQRELARG
ncbi:SRPBCC family protein [Tahibacter caeni]|uniref:SRPBCC family protein n=1 Tax=Tahibacter caeni TaxID=1453545 RepID=UPI0021474E24|nr:SRPBCC family protein [Tahibacter caeni]